MEQFNILMKMFYSQVSTRRCLAQLSLVQLIVAQPRLASLSLAQPSLAYFNNKVCVSFWEDFFPHSLGYVYSPQLQVCPLNLDIKNAEQNQVTICKKCRVRPISLSLLAMAVESVHRCQTSQCIPKTSVVWHYSTPWEWKWSK